MREEGGRTRSILEREHEITLYDIERDLPIGGVTVADIPEVAQHSRRMIVFLTQ
mgnify:CR=1 FL=1